MLLLGILYFIILIKTSKKETVKIQKDFSEEFEKSTIKENQIIKFGVGILCFGNYRQFDNCFTHSKIL